MRISKSLLAGVLAGTTLLLGACATEPGQPTGNGPTGGANPDQDDCLVGTWSLDVQDVADQMIALMSVPGAAAESDGTVTVVFGDDLTATWDDTVTMQMPVGEMPMVATAVYSGSSTNTEWSARDGVLSANEPTGDFAIAMTFSVGGVEVPMEGFDLPSMGELGGGADVAYTCSGDVATITPPAPAPTWRLTRL